MFLSLYRHYLRSGDHPCKGRFLNWWQKLLFFRGKRPLTTNEGYIIYVGHQDAVERSLLLYGTYEPKTLKFVAANLCEGGTSVCAGTAYGLHLLVSADAVGKNGRVIGIEPQPGSLISTFRNICANGMRERINLVGSAIADERKILPLTSPSLDNLGSSSFTTRHHTNPNDYHVHTATLSDLLEQLDADEPDLMVLDVEGHETKIIQSLEKTWKPKILIAEMHPWMVQNGFTDESKFYSALSKIGYKTCDLEGNPLSPGLTVIEDNVVAYDPAFGEPEWVASGS